MPKPLKRKRWWMICRTLLGGYLLLCLLLGWGQSRLMFFPSPTLKATPATLKLPYEEVWLPMPVGTVHGWWIPAASGAPVVLYFHGNGSNLGDLVNKAERWHQLGVALLLIDYRGYGYSSGQFPSEASVYEDAEAAWRYLIERGQQPKNILLYGQSLGGAVAIDLAVKHPNAAAVIVESSFTSMRAMTARSPLSYLFPLDWLLTQRFDSISKVRSLQMPILLIHGIADATIPASMSQELYAAAPHAELLLIPDADHNSVAKLGGAGYLQAIADFIERVSQHQLQSNRSRIA